VPLDEDVLELVAEEAGNLESKELSQRLADLNECISQLQVRDQELVLHRYWKKAGLAEYARASGRSVDALKSALYRVRDSLHDCINRRATLREGKA
jgi:RNA polymerase sigma-70 factor (ECF subfamily)